MDGGSGDLMAQPAKPQSADGPMAGVPVEVGGGSLNGVDKFPMTNGIGEEKPQVNNIHRENKSKENIDASREKHREKDRHRDKDRHKDKHRDKDREKDRHRDKDRDKHRDKDREKHREKDKHSSSSSSSKDKHKDGNSSSSSKPGSSSSKSKDGSSSSSKLSSSSSSKDKHSSSSSEKQKEHSSSSSKDKNRDKENRDKDKHKSSSSSSSHSAEKKESASIKKEPGSGDAAPLAIKVETLSPSKIKKEPPSSQFKAEDSDDDIPLSSRKELVKKEKESPIKKQSPVKKEKRALPESDDDDVPLSARADKVKKVKKEEKKTAKRKADDSEDDMPLAKRKKDGKDKKKDKNKAKTGSTGSTPKKKKKEEENVQTWKWWEEEKREDGVKWKFLEHKGPVFAAPYEKLPSDVNFYYNGKKMKLSDEAEEVAGFYGRMLDNDYTTKEIFNKNFFKDWRKVMTSDERAVITDLKKCNFKEMDAYYKQKSEERKNMSKEEKNKIKEENARLQEEYGFCTMDGYRQKIGNFKIEPPGLFRGRGEHPKQGMLKKRIVPEDVTINCSKDSQVPEPPKGHKWKEVRHDNAVTWLATWTENIQGQNKYVMLNPSSKIKGEKDWQKYETARRLHKLVDRIRANYREDFKSKEMRIRQRSVALYFIDKLALRAGNEKDEDQADTVGCCSLRVEHINLFENDDGQENVVEFDFLGKDSIRYTNKVSVEKRVFKNLQLFMQNKADGDDLFDRLNTSILNKHLQELMDGLTAKVFRTYNASRTLQEQLDLLTNADDPIAAKILAYNRANRAVAVLCNHQRAAPKNFDKQMENMKSKIEAKKDTIKEAKKAVKDAKSDYKASKSESKKGILERKKKALARLEEQLVKLEVQLTDKDENKEIALGTSKLNYLDPRISVAWCKKWEVPIEKVYNKTQREKFAWAIDMAEADYTFVE